MGGTRRFSILFSSVSFFLLNHLFSHFPILLTSPFFLSPLFSLSLYFHAYSFPPPSLRSLFSLLTTPRLRPSFLLVLPSSSHLPCSSPSLMFPSTPFPFFSSFLCMFSLVSVRVHSWPMDGPTFSWGRQTRSTHSFSECA